ncbi:hypothetical protein [Thomasclavelia cocleata]|uniref:hypothetical protein n=1 Tax=Thomasclavelia cocleata TaxID=69824 RepID=UPI00260E9636|nr:hypothetical protein [Thomasclavelia cocleata]
MKERKDNEDILSHKQEKNLLIISGYQVELYYKKNTKTIEELLYQYFTTVSEE